ncbi:MAG TPA: endonuclease NucS domain-containing protein [Chitinispirillaceae bacterium]|nr:endonuclease NucS domain-containing protein [Chitinispirillaceae bacterium]
MEKTGRPMIWQMIKEAVEVHGNKTDTTTVRDYVLAKYSDINVNTLLNHIILCTVNHESRVHYKENNRPRRCSDIYDILYRPSPGKIEMYDPRIHGNWEIALDESGVLIVSEVKEYITGKKESVSQGNGYISEKHLREYLSKNLDLIETGLELYVDTYGNDGVGFPTDFGTIDILASDKNGALIVISINAGTITDEATGKILKFRNWIRRHIAVGKAVRCYLIGSEIPEQARYSFAEYEDIFLREFDLSIKMREIPGMYTNGNNESVNIENCGDYGQKKCV